jgi:hypothetical protein
MTKGRVRKGISIKGGSVEVIGASEGILSNKMILPSSEFESTGTGGDTSKYETAVSTKMTGGKRRSKKSKRSLKKNRSMKKWFGLF